MYMPKSASDTRSSRVNDSPPKIKTPPGKERRQFRHEFSAARVAHLQRGSVHHDGEPVDGIHISEIDEITAVAACEAVTLKLVFHRRQAAAFGQDVAAAVIQQRVVGNFHVSYLAQSHAGQPVAADDRNLRIAALPIRNAQCARHDLFEMRIRHRLDNKVQRADLVSLERVLRHVGHENYDDILVYLSQLLRRLHAVQFRQLDVHHHDVEIRFVVCHEIDRVAVVYGHNFFLDKIRVLGNHTRKTVGDGFFILDDCYTDHRYPLSIRLVLCFIVTCRRTAVNSILKNLRKFAFSFRKLTKRTGSPVLLS